MWDVHRGVPISGGVGCYRVVGVVLKCSLNPGKAFEWAVEGVEQMGKARVALDHLHWVHVFECVKYQGD